MQTQPSSTRKNPFRRATIAVCAAAFLATAISLEAHDLFLRPAEFFVAPNAELRIAVLNGSFRTSEAAVTPDRLVTLDLAGPAGLSHPPPSTWDSVGKSSEWRVRLGGIGTYVLGASTKPRTIRLAAKDFNSYLAEDGLPDILADRRARKEIGKPARERYSKHVKAVVHAGSANASDVDSAYRRVLGYPAEIVPIDNPYSVKPGGTLKVRALVDGSPMVGQVVLAGGVTSGGRVIGERSVRTDASGVARISIRMAGAWYVKFIRMRRIPAGTDSVDYESKWATLTFGVR